VGQNVHEAQEEEGNGKCEHRGDVGVHKMFLEYFLY
jgi:hypothetical protein